MSLNLFSASPRSGRGLYNPGGHSFRGSNRPVPRIQLKKPVVPADYDPNVVRRVVRFNLPRVRWCYERALAAAPDLTGRIELRLSITSTGDVEDSAVELGKLDAPELAECIVSGTSKWRFPKHDHDGPVSIRYPIVLDPGA